MNKEKKIDNILSQWGPDDEHKKNILKDKIRLLISEAEMEVLKEWNKSLTKSS